MFFTYNLTPIWNILPSGSVCFNVSFAFELRVSNSNINAFTRNDLINAPASST